MLDGAVEATHASVAQEPHLVARTDGLVPPIDQETVESRLRFVVRRPVERSDACSPGALGFVASDVAVPEVKVGGEEASHDAFIVAVRIGDRLGNTRRIVVELRNDQS